MRNLGAIGLALAACASPASAMQSAAPVVLRARGEVAKQVAIGRPLPSGRTLTLRLGDALMLLDGKGVRTLVGPGRLVSGVFTRTGSSADARPGQNGRPRIAAVRSMDAQPWLVSLASAGAICLPAERPLLLHRPSGTPGVLQIITTAGARHSLTWPAAADTLAWPHHLPTTPSTRYRIESALVGSARDIEFREISASDPACAEQIDLNLRAATG